MAVHDSNDRAAERRVLDDGSLRLRRILTYSEIRKFNPGQPRDPRGRWTLTGAIIAALKAQGGEQGGAHFEDGRYFDWSTYDPKAQEYTLEVGEDSSDEDSAVAQLTVDDYNLEQLLNALTVTRLRDAGHRAEPTDEHSTNVAALTALGHADHLVLPDDSYIDWSTRTDTGDYGFAVGDAEGNEVAFDLTPAELQKLIASLALSTQPSEATRAMFRELETRLAGKDVTPGHDQLHHYWTRDPEGLAKWAKSPHPWTALYHHLIKYVGPERAKRMAAQWHHEVFGIWPGEKKGANKFGPG